MSDEWPVVYEIDGEDRITDVNPAWSAVAKAAPAPGLEAPQVVGRSLWEFIGDPTTRQLYRAMLERARVGERPLAFCFRCDSPTRRQLLNMRIAAQGGGRVSFEVRLVAAQERPPVALLEADIPRSAGFIRMCGWCKRIPLDGGRWVEVEEAMQALDVLDTSPLPAISHGMCPECYEAIGGVLDRNEASDADPVTLGPLPSAIEIVSARAEPEVGIVRSLFVEYAAAVGVDLCFQGFEEELATLPGDYAAPRGALFLARAGRGPLGCAALRPLPGNEAELKRLYVRPEARGSGLGRRLATRVIETATRLGYDTLRLDTLPTMREARALYASLGFQETPPYRSNPVAGTTFMAIDLHRE